MNDRQKTKWEEHIKANLALKTSEKAFKKQAMHIISQHKDSKEVMDILIAIVKENHSEYSNWLENMFLLV